MSEGNVGGGGSSGSGDGIEGAGTGGDADLPVWMEGLPDELAGEASLQQYKSIEDVAKGLVETKRMVGNSVRIPHEEAGADAFAEFDAKLAEKVPGLVRIDPDNPESVYARLGRPDDASGYETPSFDEGVQYSPDRVEAFRPIAHKHGLTLKQFQGVVADMVALESGMVGEIQQRSKAAMDAFKQSEGQRYDETVNLAAQFINTIGREHGFTMTVEQLNPLEIAMYADVMRKVGGEGDGGGGGDDIGDGKMTPAQAREEINAIRGNPDHPYNNRMAPGHEAAKRRMRELYVAEQGANNEVVAVAGGVGGSVQRG